MVGFQTIMLDHGRFNGQASVLRDARIEKTVALEDSDYLNCHIGLIPAPACIRVRQTAFDCPDEGGPSNQEVILLRRHKHCGGFSVLSDDNGFPELPLGIQEFSGPDLEVGEGQDIRGRQGMLH